MQKDGRAFIIMRKSADAIIKNSKCQFLSFLRYWAH